MNSGMDVECPMQDQERAMSRGDAAYVASGEYSFVYIEQGAPRLVAAALAAARAAAVVRSAVLHFEGESPVVGVRAAVQCLSSKEPWRSGVVALTRDEASTVRQSQRATLARTMLARSAQVGTGSLTFVASQDSGAELREQVFTLAQVLTEEFPQASVSVRFVARDMRS